MNSLRNSFFSRVLSSVLGICLSAVVVSPLSASDGFGAQYADWLRLQVSESTLPGFADALDTADTLGARSFDEFLNTFFLELDSSPDPSNGEEERSGSQEQLREELRLRFVRFVADAVLARILKAESVSSSQDSQTFRTVTYRLKQFGQKIECGDRGLFDGQFSEAHFSNRILCSSAQPLGP